MYFGYTIDDRIMEYAKEFLEDNRKHFDEISENCIVGGLSVQYHLKEKEASSDYLRPTTDIDILFKKQLKRHEFKNILDKISYYLDIETRINRSCFEICLKDGEDKIYIHFPRFTNQRYEKKKEKIKNTVENAVESNIIDFPIENIKDIVKNKKSRSIYHLKKLRYKHPEKYFNFIIDEMYEKIKEDPIKGKEIYFKLKQELANALEDDGYFYSKRVQRALRKTKIYKDAYDIACLKYFYPEYLK